MSETKNSPFDIPKLERNRVITLKAETAQQENGQWHLSGDGLDVRVIPSDRYSGLKIAGTIGDYIFTISKGKYGETAACHDKDIPQSKLDFKAEKMGNTLKIEIFLPSNKELIQTMEIRWPLPKLESFGRIVKRGWVDTMRGKAGRYQTEGIEVDDGNGAGQRILLFSPQLHHWIPAPENTTIKVEKSVLDNFESEIQKKKKQLDILAEQIDAPIPGQETTPKEKPKPETQSREHTADKEKRTELLSGKIVRWFSDKGFGFLRLTKPLPDGKSEVFVHVRDLCPHTDEKSMVGTTLFVVPHKDSKGWRVEGRQGAMCEDCKKTQEQRSRNEAAAAIIQEQFGDKYYLAEQCIRLTGGANTIEIVANALESAADSWHRSIPTLELKDRQRYAAAIVSGNQPIIAELETKIAALEKEKEQTADAERKKREHEEQIIWAEGVRRQEEFIKSKGWLAQQVQSIRDWVLKEKVDPATFSLSVDYQPIYSYSSKGWGRSGDDVEESFEGLAYVIVARGGRLNRVVLPITLEDFFNSEDFYKKNKYAFPHGSSGAFRYFIRKGTAVETKNTIDAQLADIYEQRAARVNEDHAEALLFDAAVTKLLKAREEVKTARERARQYHIDLVTPANYQLGNVDKDSLDEVEGATQSIENYIAAVEQEITNTLHERGQREIKANITKGETAERALAAVKALKEAMEAEASPAPWFLNGVDSKMIEEMTGRKQGEGIGDLVAGKNIYLPGQRALVGMNFSGGTSRYSTSIECFGLSALAQTSLPSGAGRRGSQLLAIVNDPSWRVLWTDSHDGIPTGFALANAEGITHLTGGGARYSQSRWDGSEWHSDAHVALAREAHKFNEGSGDPEIDQARDILQVSTPKAKLIRDFVAAAVGAVGVQQALAIIRKEAGEAYGRGARMATLEAKFPGINLQGLDWTQGGDIGQALIWAEHKFGKSSEPKVVSEEMPSPSALNTPPPDQPAQKPVDQAALDSFAGRLGKKFGKDKLPKKK